MRTSSEVRRLKESADAFGIKPELAWLMEAGPEWEALRTWIIDLNKHGMSADTLLALPIDNLRAKLLVLAALIGERRG